LFGWHSVAGRADGDAFACEKSCHEILGFAGLHRRQIFAPPPMCVIFGSPLAGNVRLCVHLLYPFDLVSQVICR
jgi:hypothetical protein